MPRPPLRHLLLPIALLAALAVPAVASAQSPVVVTMGHAPLQVFTDDGGSVQVRVGGRDVGEFFPSSSTSGDNAGLALVVDPGGSNQTFAGRFATGGLGTPTSGPTLVPGNPSTIRTSWSVSVGTSSFGITQLLSYSDGQNQMNSTYTITNNDPQTRYQIKLYVAGDLTIRGTDSGVGVANLNAAAPPRYVGGLNQDAGGTGVFVEQTPWSAFQSGALGDVTNAVASGMDFNGTISTQDVDNAAGVEWSDVIGPSQTKTYSVGWRFVDTFGISPTVTTQTTGNDQVFTARIGDANGNSLGAGKKVVWQVAGGNDTVPRTTTTDANGQTTFSYVGGNPGPDVVTGFADLNGNGQHDPGEPQATANVTWVGPAPPIEGQTVNVRPEKGTVLVKVPQGAPGARVAAKRLGVPLHEAATKFVKLKANQPIPLGSMIDTTHGTVRMLAAGSPTASTGGSPFMGGSFNGGVFKTRQVGRKGLTELSMAGGSLQCKGRVPKGGAPKVVAARKRRSRSLFGNAHGRFRTRGRNSSATVRGTQWLQKDTCKGTLTTVKRGSVFVHDFTKHRTVVVKTGHRYLARPPKH